ncbi:MAG: hypothetical protein ACRD40_09810, partial [Candidatus Acidiferrales bacterium]
FVLMVACVLCYQYCLLHPFDILSHDLIWKLNPRLLYPSTPRVSPWLISWCLKHSCMGYVIGARIVARFRRPHQAAFTLFNAALVLLVSALELLRFVKYNPHHLQSFPSYMSYRVALILLFVVSTLVGGLWKQKNLQPAQA